MSSDPLISAERLLCALHDVTVLDVRWELGRGPLRDEYDAGHVPGAAFVDLDADLAGPAGAGGRHPLPEAAAFEAAARRWGVARQRPVVCYDGGGMAAAARCWWLLRYFGHPDVWVLQGGWASWIRAGSHVEAGRPAVPAADVRRVARFRAADSSRNFDAPESSLSLTFEISKLGGRDRAFRADPGSRTDPEPWTARPGGLPLLDARAAASTAERGILLDARTPERFQGKHEPIDPVAGHIPGAVNLPLGEVLADGGGLREPEDVAEALERRGVPAGGGSPIAAYCGSGVTAAGLVLALATIGIEAGLYAGSWSEWITDRSRPVAIGG